MTGVVFLTISQNNFKLDNNNNNNNSNNHINIVLYFSKIALRYVGQNL